MATTTPNRLFITSVAILIFTLHASAKSPPPSPALPPAADTPSPSPDCMTSLLNMSDCLGYVQAGSNETVPDKACCPELAGLVESSPQCLCNLLGGNVAKNFGIKLDMNKATKLPSVCGVSTPPPSLCKAIGIPVGAPTGSEGPSSPGSQPKEGNNESGAPRIAGSAIASIYSLALVFSLLLPFC